MRPFFIIAAALLTVAGQAHALSNRTFVSGTGSDANPCSLVAPCRSFSGALAQTSPGGEIAVLDTAGFGAVTITHAVSIVNEEGVNLRGRHRGCGGRHGDLPGAVSEIPHEFCPGAQINTWSWQVQWGVVVVSA